MEIRNNIAEKGTLTSFAVSGTGAACRLTWLSNGFDAFLLVHSEGAMPELGPALPGQQDEWITAGNAKVYFTPFKAAQGSVPVAMPGSYQLYGVDRKGNVPVLYGPLQCEVRRRIRIQISPVDNINRGFLGLRRPPEYSGYWRINIPEPQSDLSGSCLHYQVNDYSVAFPDEVVQNGGTFYVRAPKQSQPKIRSERWLQLDILAR